MRLDKTTSTAQQNALLSYVLVSQIYITLTPKSAEKGLYSDMIIKCDNDKYHTHKVIMCTRLPFFAKACNRPFKARSPSFSIVTSPTPFSRKERAA